MENEALAREIEAFERILPEMRAQHGAAWVLMVGREPQGAFPSFDAAARCATEQFADRQVLIRHTSGHKPNFPFLVVEPA